MKRRSPPLRHRKRPLTLEPLEARQLLSLTAASVSPAWTINGTDANDVISVLFNPTTRQFDLTLNGTLVESRPVARVRRIVINGGAGDDTITVDLGTPQSGKLVPVTINGGDGNDTITGGAENDLISGGAGNDTIHAGAGNDVIGGGAGDDILDGGAGNDLIHGSTGSDNLTGDAGNDWLYGDAGDDNLDGGEGADHLLGNQGNDVLIGGLGKDTLSGGIGTDTNYAVHGRDAYQHDRHDALIPTDKPVVGSLVNDDPGDGTGSGDTPALPPVDISPELKQRLIDEAVARYKDILGTTYSNGWFYYPPGGVVAFDNGISVMATSAGGAPASQDHSDTNNQVQGVDEADLVETDGNFIYTVRNNALVVIDVRDPANAQIVSNISLDGGSVVGLYLVGNRVVVLSSTWGGYLFQPMLGTSLLSRLPTYHYQSQTTAWMFDVTDPSNAALLEKTTMTGYLASSRVIGHQLYLVLGNDASLPAPQSTIVSSTPPDSSVSSAIAFPIFTPTTYKYQTEDEYRQWLSDHIDDYVPKFATTLADGTLGPSGALLGNIQYDTGTLGAITNLLDFDVTDDTPGPAAVVTATGNPGTVYASAQNLYVAQTAANQGTTILKFNLGVQSVALDAVGQISGTPLNSYAMDEFNGQLRIMTEDWSHQTHQLFILSDAGDGHLNITGSLSGIGDGESLRAVLFLQERAFVVTFRQVDPLFAIDLSDPANPVSAGELVMPGFSTYLYPVDQNHLIGIGQGPGSQPGNFHNVQVSLYDVADLSHPVVVDQEIYQSGWVNSAAQYDPHAFSYFADQGVLAIPLSSFGWINSENTDQNSLLVLKVNPDSGFQQVGQVIHDSTVQRSLRIGDNLYSLADGDLKVVELLHPAHLLADVVLPAAPPGIIGNLPIFVNLIAAPMPVFSVSQPIAIAQ